MTKCVCSFLLLLAASNLLVSAKQIEETQGRAQHAQSIAALTSFHHKNESIERAGTSSPDQGSNIPQNLEQVSSLRPRLYVRADDAKIGRGLTVSGLRARSNDPAYRDWIHNGGVKSGSESLVDAAMQYLLKGDETLALEVGKRILERPFSFKEHTSAAASIYNTSIAFDWVRNGLTDDMAHQIATKLVEGAEHLKDGVIRPSINHNYSIVSLYAVATVAVAVYGEGEENTQRSLEYLDLINNTLTRDNFLLETFQQKQGTWGEGNHYTPFVVFHPFLMTLRALATGTNTDYFSLIRNDYGNFIKPMAKFVVANFRPDFTLERIGDVSNRVVPVNTFLRPLIELLASEIDDPELQGQVHSFSQAMRDYFDTELESDSYSWMMMVTYDSKLPNTPSYKTLPHAMRLGENSYEHIMFRNSWEEDGTLITYISGDHYTDHQHFDKGHFLIYKKGGLVIDGGGYGSPMYGDNWSNYSTRTLAHNNVLVHDPAANPYEGIAKTMIYPDGGQRILRGVQNSKDWEDYLTNNALNTADVLAYYVDDQLNRYNYVKTNLTNAYDSTTTWMDRQLLYLPLADYLVVKDRVITSKPLKKYWLLHFEQTPLVDGKTPATGITDYKDARVVRSNRTDKLETESKTVPYSGSLLIKSLTPKKSTVSIIGGEGYEYYNRFAGKNFPNGKPFSSIIEPGHWRMEEGTNKPTTATSFVHAFEIADVNKKEMVPTEYLETQDKKMEGALFLSNDNPYVVLFSNSLDGRGDTFQKVQFPVNYKLKASGSTIHVLVELQPNKKVTVTINRKNLGSFETNDAGVLSFKDEGKGARKVRIEAE